MIYLLTLLILAGNASLNASITDIVQAERNFNTIAQHKSKSPSRPTQSGKKGFPSGYHGDTELTLDRLKKMAIASRHTEHTIDSYLKQLEGTIKPEEALTQENFVNAYLRDKLNFENNALQNINQYQPKVQDFLTKAKPLLEDIWKHIVELSKKDFPSDYIPDVHLNRLSKLATGDRGEPILKFYLKAGEAIKTRDAFIKDYLKKYLEFAPNALDKIDDYKPEVQEFLQQAKLLLIKVWDHIVDLSKKELELPYNMQPKDEVAYLQKLLTDRPHENSTLKHYVNRFKKEKFTQENFNKEYLTRDLKFKPKDLEALEKIDEYQQKDQEFLTQIRSLLVQVLEHIIKLSEE